MDKGTVQARASARIACISRGHTDEVVRLIAFLAIGAVVASLNLVVVWLLSRQSLLPYVTYITLATEFSILCSFVLNDRITFQRLTAGGHRWYMRCVRFHSAAAVGALFTIGLSTAVYHLAHLPPVTAQFIAIVVATGLNFSMHRFWTYRSPTDSRAHAPHDRQTIGTALDGIEVTVPAE